MIKLLFLRTISIVVVLFFCSALAFLGSLSLGEGYNPCIPDIDTYFTNNFSDSKFKAIRIGDDTCKVIGLIGCPFHKQDLSHCVKLWYYTGDGKCQWMDFAWLGKELEIDSLGKVVSINEPVHYD